MGFELEHHMSNQINMNMVETILDGNRSTEMLEWCENNITPDSWMIEQIDQISTSVSSPSLLHWRWMFETDDDLNKFIQTWPVTYQMNIVYRDTGSCQRDAFNSTDGVYCADTWDAPDAWNAWANSAGIVFETHRVKSSGSWLYTMGELMAHKFDVRCLRFACKEDATKFVLTWGIPG